MRLLWSVVLVGLVFLPVSFVAAVPAGSSVTPPPPVEPVQLLSQASDPRRPWIRLRDWAIETIWGISKSCSQHSSLKVSSCNRSPPPKVLAWYGSDVVLRFHIRSVEESRAMAEAIEVLFLDTWASTPDFVDIRLAQEVVSSTTGPSLLNLNGCFVGMEWACADRSCSHLGPDSVLLGATARIASHGLRSNHRRPRGDDLCVVSEF